MGHAMPDSRDDFPTASSMGFGATTTTTWSLGVLGVEADDDDGVELVLEIQKIKKVPQRSPESMCIYTYSSKHLFLCMCLFLCLVARKLEEN